MALTYVHDSCAVVCSRVCEEEVITVRSGFGHTGPLSHASSGVGLAPDCIRFSFPDVDYTADKIYGINDAPIRFLAKFILFMSP